MSLPPLQPKLDWPYVIVFSFLHVGAVASLFFFSWTNLGIFFALYMLGGLGITVGYHRLLTHRSFQVPRWLERCWATAGALALEGGPLSWVSAHRLHHKESDRELDPHNITKGFWHAHIGWIFKRDASREEEVKRRFAPDLMKDPYYRWLDRNGTWLAFGVGALLLIFGGWGAFLWGFCLRIVCMQHATWLVNSAAHLWGYRPWPEERATNNWWVALVSFGEGWHNNHHAHPTSARHGLRTFEIDPSWILIWTMSKLGLARKLKLPEPSELPWTAKAAELRAG